MTLSVEAQEQVRRLLDSASDLLKKLASLKDDSRSGVSDAMQNLQRYADLLTSGLDTASLDTALRGANLMTTVNKGLSDAVATDRAPEIATLAFELSKHAIHVAKLLRTERGGPL